MADSASVIHPVQVGPVLLRNNLVLAAMHKRTHLAFRLLTRRAGAALAHTEMATPEDLLGANGPRMARNILHTIPEDRPLAVQMLPRTAGPLAEAVAMVSERGTADLVDLNFACPSKRVAGSGRGAAFLKDPEAAIRLVETAAQAGRLPVTVKMRYGYTDSPEHQDLALELARGAVAAGAVAIILHARTAVQLYHGQADWQAIARWRQLLPVPIFGSGDLRTPEAVVAMLRETLCAGASIARGAFGAPWVFRQTIELAETGSYPPVTMQERARVFMEHYDGLAAQYGPVGGLRLMCQIGRLYARSIRRGAEARVAIQNARTADDLRRVVDEYFV